jgi:hypothetical protein
MGIDRAQFLTDDRQAASTAVLHRDRARAHLAAGGTRAECACAPDRARDGGGGQKPAGALSPVVARETVSTFHRDGFYGLSADDQFR